MPLLTVTVSCPITDTPRVRQVASLFDLAPESKSAETFSVELPDATDPWTVGVIIGPSGSGKTTIARAAFGQYLVSPQPWPEDQAVIDGFGELPVERITHALTAVGFGSPPAWLKPHRVLSNGEKLRCDLARALLADVPLVAFDEFTSLVDRTVARISSAAVAKAVRSGALVPRFVAITCHADVVEWLEPDWVLDMEQRRLTRGRLRRPRIRLEIRSAARDLWDRFKRHHYLSARLHPAARCFVATVDGRPAAFAAALPFPHPRRPGWREHRTVCLPDFQGIGIGTALSEFVAGVFVTTGRPYFSTTSHPAVIRHRSRSSAWRMLRPPGRVRGPSPTTRAPGLTKRNSAARNTASFEYVGASRPTEARMHGVLSGKGPGPRDEPMEGGHCPPPENCGGQCPPYR